MDTPRRAICSIESSSLSDCVDRDVLTHAAQTHDNSRGSNSGLGTHREPTCCRFVGDAIFVLERLTAFYRGFHQRTDALAVVVVDHAEVRSKRAFEIQRIYSVHPMQFVAPLHGVGTHVPQPPTDMSQCFPFAESLIDLGQSGLGKTGLGELLDHANGSRETAMCVEHRRDRQRNRHLHAVLALDLRDKSIDALACGHALLDGLHITAEMRRHEGGESFPDDLALGVAEDPLCPSVPADDMTVDVLAEQREGRQVGEDVECSLTAHAALVCRGFDQRDGLAEQLVDGNTEDGCGRRVCTNDDTPFSQLKGRDDRDCASIPHEVCTISQVGQSNGRGRPALRRPCWQHRNGVLSPAMAAWCGSRRWHAMASIADDLRGGSTVDTGDSGDIGDIGDSLAVAALSLARRFADGATLWCIAPEWPEHARHVAVEFVHPVLVGKRALPAVSVDSTAPVVALRSLVRAGDVVLAVSRADSEPIIDAMRRAEAWGATTIWIGVGHRPPDRAADHILWVDDAQRAGSAALYDGQLVLLYHVLWELTHVCFEHPGLLSGNDAGCTDEVCITCSDEGRLGEVISAEASRAMVRTAKGIERIDTTAISDVGPGDLVLIHAGAAIAEVP